MHFLAVGARESARCRVQTGSGPDLSAFSNAFPGITGSARAYWNVWIAMDWASAGIPQRRPANVSLLAICCNLKIAK